MAKTFNVAVVGATGAVGQTMIRVLEERNFPVGEIRFLASERSEGKELSFKTQKVRVRKLDHDSFDGIDIAIFSAGGDRSLTFAPSAAKAGAVVVDNSNAWRMDPEIPLVVPEVNPHAVSGYKAKGIIANPNCSTIQMVVALKPLYDYARIKRIVVSTYQAVSGSGKKAIVELEDQVKSWAEGRTPEARVYPHQIAFNCLPHIDVFLDNGYTREEMKMLNETRKIMEAPGIKVVDDLSLNIYPLALDAEGQDLTLVGRIREDISQANGLDFWVVADNIRKGAATNAVQIAEVLVEKYL
ncbi:MAG: aspartate-semialdehyde dehydrogenase [Deltaproteobacteria bacterium]|nr:aspartate-semialdehyde dehydrogenase [Deltaproteobacteria bacterium]